MLRNTTETYSSITKFFHWTVSLAAFALLISGIIQINVSNKKMVFILFTSHKTLGIMVLGFMGLRLSWRSINATPNLSHIPTWQRLASRTAHFLLYGLLIAMPLSGWIMSTASGHAPSLFGQYPFPMPGIELSKPIANTAKSLHMVFAISLVTVLSLHILAAFKHHFINKDHVLIRMLPGKKKP